MVTLAQKILARARCRDGACCYGLQTQRPDPHPTSQGHQCRSWLVEWATGRYTGFLVGVDLDRGPKPHSWNGSQSMYQSFGLRALKEQRIERPGWSMT